MRGLMMDYQLTIPAIMRRVETLSADVEVVSRRGNRGIDRYTYADMVRRAKQLAVALQDLGVRPGDRVGTLAWNHHRHLEAYFAVPAIGAILHTLNLRLHPKELATIANHAADRFLIVDRCLLPLLERFRPQLKVEAIIVMDDDGAVPDYAIDYDGLLARSDASRFVYPEPDEHDAAAMCYTSGTTGQSKGVLYSHRSIVLQSMHWTAADGFGLCRRDVVLSVVPMFHINGWGMAFTAALVGAKLVLPGEFLDPSSVLELIHNERVTLSAGVPTVWLGVLQALEKDHAHDVASLRTIIIGGSAVPEALLRGYDRLSIRVVQAWGMTEMAAVGTVSLLPPHLDAAPPDDRYRARARQGAALPFVEIRARGENGFVPWDGESMGELEVRGPTVASQYYDNAAATECFTDDGWFRTGDIVTIDRQGSIEIKDRSKDLIKSGGEWISSVALENALMGHPAVAEAAVVGVPDGKWDERPLACIVVKPGCAASVDELRSHLAADFPKWWIPDAFEFIDAIPRTSTGKFLKSALRERYRGQRDTPATAHPPIPSVTTRELN
jgi:fatty-acyl-CoA synthase